VTLSSDAHPHVVRVTRAETEERTPLGQAVTVACLVGIVCLWSVWPALRTMAERWSSDPQYSHGFLVPVFAGLVLWFRRADLAQARLRPNWWGLAFVLPAIALRLAGATLDFEAADAFALLPTLAGLILLLYGWDVLRWSWPAIAFLAFMIPLPFQLEGTLAHPLRRIATVASTYVLQTLGFPAVAEGNIILIDDLRLGVIDACSGLGMLMTFFALATAMAMVIPAPRLDRSFVVASAIPIAIIANVMRVSATAIAHRWFGSDVANALMHDLAGWLMMPLALGLMWLELRLLNCLLVPVEESRPLFLDLPAADRTASAPCGNGPALRSDHSDHTPAPAKESAPTS
jgi:exosortase